MKDRTAFGIIQLPASCGVVWFGMSVYGLWYLMVIYVDQVPCVLCRGNPKRKQWNNWMEYWRAVKEKNLQRKKKKRENDMRKKTCTLHKEESFVMLHLISESEMSPSLP